MKLIALLVRAAAAYQGTLVLEYCNADSKQCVERGRLIYKSANDSYYFQPGMDISDFSASWVTMRLTPEDGSFPQLISSAPVTTPGISSGEELTVFIGPRGDFLSASLRQTLSGEFSLVGLSDEILAAILDPEEVLLDAEISLEDPVFTFLKKYWFLIGLGALLSGAAIGELTSKKYSLLCLVFYTWSTIRLTRVSS